MSDWDVARQPSIQSICQGDKIYPDNVAGNNTKIARLKLYTPAGISYSRSGCHRFLVAGVAKLHCSSRQITACWFSTRHRQQLTLAKPVASSRRRMIGATHYQVVATVFLDLCSGGLNRRIWGSGLSMVRGTVYQVGR